MSMKLLKKKEKDIEFDYFGENKKDFYNKFSVNSVLVQGRHKDKIPMVTIILTTYKRPEVLKQALESALKQVNFNDYQILVVDNEGVSLGIETETSKLIAGYSDSKIIYYRHEQSVDYKMDYAVRLARSPWICFLHDDDLLKENHLSVMTDIIKRNKKIKFLSCPNASFYNTIEKAQFLHLTKRQKARYQVIKYPAHYTCTGYYPGWLGALINRQCYINTGGMPTISNGIGDYCMVGKFLYRYGIYQCNSNNALYLYRRWSQQVSSAGAQLWSQAYIAEYKYHKYVVKKYHKFFVGFWERISAYMIIEKCKQYNQGFYSGNINIEKIMEKAEIPQNILNNGKKYKRDMLWLNIYKYLVNSEQQIDWKELNDKHLSLFLLMNDWVQVLQQNKSISAYLIGEGYQSVAIYGISYVGITLLRELQNSNINIKYVIDKNKNVFISKCKIVDPDAYLENVDAIIVTSVYYYQEIRRELLTKINCPIISLRDILKGLLSY